MIPQRIIRCYRSRYLFTPAMEENGQRLQSLHPDWELPFFNHHEARAWVAAQTPEWLTLYDFYPVDRQREQVFRWLALWKLGGFWLSTQIRPLLSLEPLRNQPLVLAAQNRLSVSRFETLHRCPWDTALPEESLTGLTDHGFAAEAGHWFTRRVLHLLVERAGFLDAGSEPSPEDEEYTTGAGVLHAAWLSSLLEDRPVKNALLAPRPVTRPWTAPGNRGGSGRLAAGIPA